VIPVRGVRSPRNKTLPMTQTKNKTNGIPFYTARGLLLQCHVDTAASQCGGGKGDGTREVGM